MKKPVWLLAVSIAAFIVLGMPKSAFGVAWPSVAGDISRPLGDLGLLITIYVLGYFIASVATGAMTRRLPVGSLLVIASLLATVSLVGYATASTWTWLLVAAVGLGVAGGFIDAGVNAIVAVRHGARAMGMLHAGFGIGATLGPLTMTALVASEQSWRVGFVVFGVLQGALVVLYLRTRKEWSVAPEGPEVQQSFDRKRRGVLWGALAVFALYSGVEVGTGQWAFTLLTENRGVSAGVAGAGVTAFWAGLTAARLGLGMVGHRVSINRTLGVASVLVAGSVAALWLTRSEWVSLASLVVMGVALGPIFPLQTTLTPGRVGVAYTPTAVGFQLAAATVGAALIPGGLGLLVSWSGLGVVAPVLFVTAILLSGAIELLRRMVRSMPTREISTHPE